MNDIEPANTSCITPDMEQARAEWHDRFKSQKTARLQTLRECVEELYGQDMQIHQGKDMMYKLYVEGVYARRFATIVAAGLAITELETMGKIIMGIDARRCGTTQAPAMDKSPLDGMTASETVQHIMDLGGGIQLPMVEVEDEPEPPVELTEVQQSIISVIKATEARIDVLIGDAENQIKAFLGSAHVHPMLGLESWNPATKGDIRLALQLRCGV